jgi:hypothetical protein
MSNGEKDFQALIATIESIYDLRGIGVSAAYVSRELWEYMVHQSLLPPFGSSWNCADQYFTEAEPEVSTTQDGKVKRITIKPYGADRIPVKVKYSGSNPWKVVATYRKD